MIRAEQAILDELAGDDWWVDVTLPMLEYARRHVRGLVRLLEKRKRVVVYTDFIDDLGDLEEVELRALRSGDTYERFREKARAYLGEHEDHLALQKLRRNVPLTQTDLDELDRMLRTAGVGDVSHIDRASTEPGGLGTFMRSLVGLDRAAATEALSRFVDGKTLNAAQHDFIALVVSYLTANGLMDAQLLYDQPFTTVAPGGPEEIFPVADVDELVARITSVNKNAQASAA